MGETKEKIVLNGVNSSIDNRNLDLHSKRLVLTSLVKRAPRARRKCVEASRSESRECCNFMVLSVSEPANFFMISWNHPIASLEQALEGCGDGETGHAKVRVSTQTRG
jgi:hypothetical protein